MYKKYNLWSWIGLKSDISCKPQLLKWWKVVVAVVIIEVVVVVIIEVVVEQES